MLNATMRSAIAIAAPAVLVCVPSVAGAQVTYQNDTLASGGDGQVSCGFVVGEKFGSVFVPDEADLPFLVEEVQFILAPYRAEGSSCVEATPRESVTVTVEIWNDDTPMETPPRPPVYQSSTWNISSSTSALNVLTISDDQDVLIESGVVRVAITIPELDTMPVRDTDGITTERNLIYTDADTWRWAEDLSVTGDWLLRMVVIPQPSDEVEAVEPGPDASEDVLEDVVDDVSGDAADDVAEDPGEEQPEGRLGGGGCSCSVTATRRHASLCILVLFALLALRSRRI